MTAVAVAIDGILNGKKAKTKYPEKPILEEVLSDAYLTEEEREKRDMEREILAMEQWIANDRARGLPETKII